MTRVNPDSSHNSIIAHCLLATCGVWAFLLTAENATAANCLERNNDHFSLGQGQVYTNGKLKLRINGWTINHSGPLTAADVHKMTSEEISRYAAAAGHNDLDMRSNAAGFNGGGFDNTGFRTTDNGNLCPGIELTLVCSLNQSTWSCKVSEF
jgi:hypothetical protein